MTRLFLRLLGYEPHKIDGGGRAVLRTPHSVAPPSVVDPAAAAFARLALVMEP